MTDRDLMDERMDARLAGYAARWRDTLPAPAESIPTTGSPSRRGWLVPAAAAAAVVIVLGVTFAVVGGDSEKDGTGPGGSDSRSTSQRSDQAPQPVGIVRGTVTMAGGPAPGATVPVTSGEISFTGDNSAHGVSIGADGTFRIEVPPGVYDVEVSTPDWNGGAPYSDGAFGVTGGTTNRLDVVIPIE